MSPDSWAAASAVGVAGLSLAGTAYTARAGRKPAGAERRDDFTAVTERMERELERLAKRVDEQELQSAEQRARISGQDWTIRYLVGWVRSLVGFVVSSGLEPPPAPTPVPEEVRPYLSDLDV